MSTGRTPEEREAARLERERRRSQPQADRLDGHELIEAEDELELPAGTRRVSRRDRAQRRPARPSAARSRRPWAGRLQGRPQWFRRAVAIASLVVAIALIWFLFELFQPFHGDGHGSITVTIPPRSSSGQVGDLLEREGVISSSFFFELRATLAGKRGQLRAGTYHLKLDMSYGSVLRIMTTPPPPAKVTEITIVEGRTRRQIDALLHSQGIRGSYISATRSSPLLNPRQYGAPRRIRSLEGFLFPSTYQLREPVSVKALVAAQLTSFRQRFARVNLSFAKRKHYTPYQVLIIASMIEAEAQHPRDRPLIASVIYNRLAAGMPLQIDATTRYATGNYTAPLTTAQLSSHSPYNTRINKGMPPTPIDNPGMSSLQAAAHPAATNYLYFVVKPCGNGEHAFASTFSEFQAEVRQYQSARRQRGGRSPARC